MNDTTVTIGSEKDKNLEAVSLMDIAGMEMDIVEAFHFTSLPKGLYQFDIKNFELTEKETAAEIVRPVVILETEISNCLKMLDKTASAEDQIGRKFSDTIYITDIARDVGRVKAFVEDIGIAAEGTLQDWLDACIGESFTGIITEQKDKNDESKKYARLDYNSIQAVQEVQVANG